MSGKRDDKTLDLLAWEPPPLVARYEETVVRAASLRTRIAHGVSETLKACGRPREEIAEAMSAWLGEDVKKSMLDAYASEAREEHTIPYLRLLALAQVTGDMRLLSLGAEMFGFAVISERYVPAVEEAMWAAEEERAREMRQQKRRQWKGGR